MCLWSSNSQTASMGAPESSPRTSSNRSVAVEHCGSSKRLWVFLGVTVSAPVLQSNTCASFRNHVLRRPGMAKTRRSVGFFHDYEGDVVRLRHALSEILNRFEKSLLDRVTPRRGVAPNDFLDSLLVEHFPLGIFRIRQAVGIDHQNVSRAEMQGACFPGERIEDPEDSGV